MTRTSGTGWDAAANSQFIQQSSAQQQGVQFRFVYGAHVNGMIGLSNDDAPEVLEFSVQTYGSPPANEYVRIWENGGFSKSIPGPYDPADLYEIRVVGTVVTYLRNGATIHTSLKTPTFPLLVDAALFNTGSTVKDVAITC
jgi:hypothetical protein